MRNKLFVILSLLLAGGGNLCAQPRIADSLSRILTTHRQEDTDKVNLMNQLSVELRRSQPKRVDSFVNAALGLSDKLNYTKGKGNALAIKAARYYDVSDYPLATKTFGEAEPLLVSARDINGQIYLLTMRANLFMDEGNYPPALDHFLRALKMAEQTGDIRQIADVNRLLGYFYNIIGEYEKAIPYQTTALRQAEGIGDKLAISGLTMQSARPTKPRVIILLRWTHISKVSVSMKNEKIPLAYLSTIPMLEMYMSAWANTRRRFLISGPHGTIIYTTRASGIRWCPGTSG